MANGLEIVERRAFSIVEAAQMCAISRATGYKLIEQNKLETAKIGSRRLVPLSAIGRPSKRGCPPLVRGLNPEARCDAWLGAIGENCQDHNSNSGNSAFRPYDVK